ncbi:hypothetical protein D3C76_1581160 [compost metagenome]
MEYTPSCATVIVPPNQMRSPYMANTPTIEDSSIQRPNTISSVSAARSHCRRLCGPCKAKWPSNVPNSADARPAITSDQMDRVKYPITSIVINPTTCDASSISTTRFC